MEVTLLVRKLERLEKIDTYLDIINSSHEEKQFITKRFDIRTITPAFVFNVNENPNNLIRTSTIRGHLRFWWRATRGARFNNVYDLRRQEIEIFGDTSNPSRVKLWVENEKVETRDISPPQYVGFPFKEDAGKQFTFTLCVQISMKEKHILEDEIYPALWAWINFGGIGQRTRRGCGSLYCDMFSPTSISTDSESEAIKEWFDNKIKHYKLELLENKDLSREWPILQLSKLNVGTSSSSIDAVWKNAIKPYQEFRECLRETFESSLQTWIKEHSEHAPPLQECVVKQISFGMPIIYKSIKFKENHKARVAIEPSNKSRLASPLIIKPLAINDGFMACPAWFLLIHPNVTNVQLSFSNVMFFPNENSSDQSIKKHGNHKKKKTKGIRKPVPKELTNGIKIRNTDYTSVQNFFDNKWGEVMKPKWKKKH